MFCRFYNAYLKTQEKNNLYRTLKTQSDNHTVYVDFSSNSYLGLHRHPKVVKSALEAAEHFGCGATGARLLSGHFDLLQAFEARLARDKKTEAALLFSSGFTANTSALSCLLDQSVLTKEPLVFFDKLNHASLYQAVFLSKARLIRYRHNDMQHLSDLLQKNAHLSNPQFIVTETLFGMDGDTAALEDIAGLARQHGAFLYLDEAHATGMLGENGYGLSTTLDLSDTPCAIMGTFSKALGTSGAFVACSRDVQTYLVNRCAGFVYATAPSPLTVGAAFGAWKQLQHLASERAALLEKGAHLRHTLRNEGFDTGLSTTWIVPLIMQAADKAQQLYRYLLHNSFLTACIRPPTVPPNTARLRLSLNTSHTTEQLAALSLALLDWAHKAQRLRKRG
ncbi:MAG: 8-amino-7-oxononanoate synthase [Holosporaceae bacterium]